MYICGRPDERASGRRAGGRRAAGGRPSGRADGYTQYAMHM